MKRYMIVLSCCVVLLFSMFIFHDTASAQTLKSIEGDYFHLMYYRSNDQSVVVPLKGAGENLDYTIGIDSNLDGKVDNSYKAKGDSKGFIGKTIKVDSSNFDVYINGLKVPDTIKMSNNNDISRGLMSEDGKSDSSIVVLGTTGIVGETEIDAYTTYSGGQLQLPVTINSYGQLAPRPWVESTSLRSFSSSQRSYLESVAASEGVLDFDIDIDEYAYTINEQVDIFNSLRNSQRLKVYIPTHVVDSTLYDLPEVNAGASNYDVYIGDKIVTDFTNTYKGSVLQTYNYDATTKSIDSAPIGEIGDYINLADLVYINPLCNKADDFTNTETDCGRIAVDLDNDGILDTISAEALKTTLFSFTWNITPDICMEKFSGRMYLDCSSQPTVRIDSTLDVTSTEYQEVIKLIDAGARDDNDPAYYLGGSPKLSKDSEGYGYGLSDALPVQQESLNVLLADEELTTPIIAETYGFGGDLLMNPTDVSTCGKTNSDLAQTDLNDYETGGSAEGCKGVYEVKSIKNDNSSKAVGRGFSTPSKYIFQRVDLSYEEERTIENKEEANNDGEPDIIDPWCPAPDNDGDGKGDCTFTYGSDGNELKDVDKQFESRTTMYASDFVNNDSEVTITHEIETCRDLESIGKGEGYPGASHYEAWPLNDDYRLKHDIDCSETGEVGSIYDSNLGDSTTDGFDPIGTKDGILLDEDGDGDPEIFNSEFDGNGYSISNLTINAADSLENVGLFTSIGSLSNVHDIMFVNANVTGNSSVASVGTAVGNSAGNVYNIFIPKITTTTTNTAGQVGGIIGLNTGSLYNSYSYGTVIGLENTGGAVGENQGYINNIYTAGVVSGTNNTGGLVGTSSSNIQNSYSITDVTSTGENVGGLVGTNTGNVLNSYSATYNREGAIGEDDFEKAVIGINNVGGLVGTNTGNITNSFSMKNISVPNDGKTVGGIAGVDSGVIQNSYGYGGQSILYTDDGSNKPVSSHKLIGSGQDGSDSVKVGTDQNFLDSAWYTNTVQLKGLSWIESSAVQESNNDWTAPYDSMCLPHVYNDEDGNGIVVGNTSGTYVPEQPCIKLNRISNKVGLANYKLQVRDNDIILKYAPIPGQEENLTGDAGAIDIDGFKLTDVTTGVVLTDDATGTCIPHVNEGNIYDGSSVNGVNPNPNPESRTITFKGLECGMVGGNKYQIDIAGGTVVGQESFEEDVNLVVQMPNIESNTSAFSVGYSIVGDNSNTNTFVSSSSGFVDPYAELTSGVLAPNPSTTSNKYGIYELESIGYEDANGLDYDGDGSGSTPSPNPTPVTTTWDENDLTLTKYDHVIRPIDGKYEISENVDASVTNPASTSYNSAVDKLGGFGTDGFRPIGQNITTPSNAPKTFTGELTGDYSAPITISSLYINEPSISYVGLIANSQTTTGTLNNIIFKAANVSGNDYVGALAGQSTETTITNTDVTNDGVTASSVKGSDYVGGLIGSGNIEIIENKNTDVSVVSSSTASSGGYAGGLIGKNTSDITVTDVTATVKVDGSSNNIGGLIGYQGGNVVANTITIQADTAVAPDIDGKGYIGGVFGRITGSGEFENITSSADVKGTYNYVGGIAGSVEGLATTTGIDNKVKNISVDTKVQGKDYVGGSFGSITDSVDLNTINAKIWVDGSGSNIGGIIGYEGGNITTNDVTSTTNGINITVQTDSAGADVSPAVDGISYIGGVAGRVVGNIDLKYITSSANVKGTYNYVGGVVGKLEGVMTHKLLKSGGVNTVKNANLNATVQGYTYVGGAVGYADDNISVSDSSISNISSTDFLKVGVRGVNTVGGMVGYSETATVNNATITSTVRSEYSNVGGIIGQTGTANVTNSSIVGTVEGQSNYIGGAVGLGVDVTVQNFNRTGPVRGSQQIGGVIGGCTNGNIDTAILNGTVTGTSSYVGGNIGYATDTATIANVDVTGDVMAINYSGSVGSYVGGSVGKSNNSTNITNTFVHGDVRGGNYVGGLVGKTDEMILDNISNENTGQEVAGLSYVGGFFGEIGTGNFEGVSDSDKLEINNNIWGTGDYIGGFIGQADVSTLKNIKTVGTVTGEGAATDNGTGTASQYVGGLVGNFKTYGEISKSVHQNSSSATPSGDIKATGNYVGGFVGHAPTITITESMMNINGSGLDGVIGYSSVGGLIGASDNSTSINTTVTSDVTGSTHANAGGVGGVVGNVYDTYESDTTAAFPSLATTVVKDTVVTGNISGGNSVGGVIGNGLENTVGCSSKSPTSVSDRCVKVIGDVTGTGNYVGGLVGTTEFTTDSITSITNSEVDGDVKGGSFVGGLVSYAHLIGIDDISNENTGQTVSGDYKVGGFFGQVDADYDSSGINDLQTDNIVKGTGAKVGGLIGHNGSCLVKNDISTGYVQGKEPGLGIEDKYAANKVGGLIGFNDTGEVKNSSHVTGEVDGGNEVGGLIGFNQAGNITDSYSDSKVIGTENMIGGLIGNNMDGDVVDSYHALAASGADPYGKAGDVSSIGEKSTMVGGLIGYNGSGNISSTTVPNETNLTDKKTMNNSYVSGVDKVGGLIGWNKGTSTTSTDKGGNITNTYEFYPDVDEVAVKGTGNEVGGLIGRSDSGTTVTQSFAMGEVVGGNTDTTGEGNYVGGLIGWSAATVEAGRYRNSDSDSDGEVVATGSQVGGLIGYQQGHTVSDSYSLADVEVTKISGGKSVGGLIGYQDNAAVNNSYTTGNVEAVGYNRVGGFTGFQEEGSIKNAYAGKTVSYDATNDTVLTTTVQGNQYVGGLVGYNFKGTIDGTYSYNTINGSVEDVGGLIGYNKDGFLNNSFSPSYVNADGNHVGGLIGFNDGSYEHYIENSYGYEEQLVYAKNGQLKNLVVGNDQSVTSFFSYLNVTTFPEGSSHDDGINEQWYGTDKGSGGGVLQWKRANWGDYGFEGTDGSGRPDGTICYPLLYNTPEDVTIIPTAADKLPEQPSCNVIVHPKPPEENIAVIKNYKIDAMSLDITLELDAEAMGIDPDTSKGVKSSNDSTFVTVKNLSDGSEKTVDEEITNGSYIKLLATDYDIKQDTDYEITFSIIRDIDDKKVENSLTVHTPKQKTINYDLDDNGVAEKVTFAVIGDNSTNTRTYVDSDFKVYDSTNTPTGETGKLKESSLTRPDNTDSKYGIYELESVCYDETQLGDDMWGENDLTLYKYDHIIRPCAGLYMLDTDIDASITNPTSSTYNGANDIQGGFGTDGFRPIANKIYPFQGAIAGNVSNSLVDLDSQAPKTISNLYISSAGIYTGLVAYSQNSFFKFVGLENVTVKGQNNVGSLIGWADNDVIVSDCYAKGDGEHTTFDIIGQSNVGGLIGFINDVNPAFNDNHSVVHDSYTELDVTANNTVGGLIGYSWAGEVEDSHFEGTVVADGSNVGGLIGQSEYGIVKNCYADFTSMPVFPGESNYGGNVGGLIGDDGSLDTINSYSKGNIIKSTGSNVGGLNGMSSSDVLNSHTEDLTSIEGSVNVGGLIGRSMGSVIGSTSNTATVDATGGSDVHAGGLIGWSSGNVTNSIPHGDVINLEGENYIGGVIGYMTDGTVSSVHPEGILNYDGGYPASYVGGLIGYESCLSLNDTLGNTAVNTSYAEIPIKATGDYIGGLIGQQNSKRKVTNSYETADVTSVDSTGAIGVGKGSGNYVGGLIGYTAGSVVGDSTKVTATGEVYAINGDYVGGLIGEMRSEAGYVTNASATGTVTANTYIGGLVGNKQSGGDVTGSHTTTPDIIPNGSETDTYAGGLIGHNTGGNVDSSDSALGTGQTLEAQGNYVGGLIGKNDSGSISNSHSIISVKGVDYVGGLAGQLQGTGNVESSYATGNTTGNTFVGGLIGAKHSDGDVIDSKYEGGLVTATGENKDGATYVGGLIGHDIKGNVVNSTSTVKNNQITSPGDYVGGLIGRMDGTGTVENSKSTINVTGPNCVGGLIGYTSATVIGDGSTTTVLATGTATATGNYAGGLIGEMAGSSGLSYVSATGAVQGVAYVGGLVGGKDSTGNVSYSTSNNPSVIATGVDSDGTSTYIGGLIGYNTGGNVDYSTSTSPVDGFGNYAGGLVGKEVGSGAINHSSASGAVEGNAYVGGLIGSKGTGNVSNSTSDNPSVIATDVTSADGVSSYIGGLIGYNSGGAINTSSSTSTKVEGPGYYAGGLVGKAAGNTSFSSDSSTSSVKGKSYVGGLVGSKESTGSVASSDANNPSVVATGFAPDGTSTYIGGLIGYNTGGNISSSTSTVATISAPGDYAGGLVGKSNSTGYIKDSTSTSAVSGKNYVGGIVGYTKGYVIGQNGFTTTTGNISGNNYVGGIAGTIDYGSSGDLDYLSSTGSVTAAQDYAGGLVGQYTHTSCSTTNGEIKHSNHTGGVVSGKNYVGGLIGQTSTCGNINTNKVTSNVTGISNVGGLIGQKSGNGGNASSNTVGDSVAVSTITGTSDYVGGLFGQVSGTGNVYNNKLFSNVTGANYVGGIIGQRSGTSGNTYSNTVGYDTGVITIKGTGDYVGGVVGQTSSSGNKYSNKVLANVSGVNNVGGIVGDSNANNSTSTSTSFRYLYSNSIGNDTKSVTITGTGNNVGGVIGNKSGGPTRIDSTGVNANVTGANNVGGLVGKSESLINIDNDYTRGQVKANTSTAGGLVGQGGSTITVDNSYSSSSVIGGAVGGGLVGSSTGNATIQNVYFNGSVSGSTKGGIIGSGSGTIYLKNNLIVTNITNLIGVGVNTGPNNYYYGTGTTTTENTANVTKEQLKSYSWWLGQYGEEVGVGGGLEPGGGEVDGRYGLGLSTSNWNLNYINSSKYPYVKVLNSSGEVAYQNATSLPSSATIVSEDENVESENVESENVESENVDESGGKTVIDKLTFWN